MKAKVNSIGSRPYMSHFQGITALKEKPPAPIRMDTGGAR